MTLDEVPTCAGVLGALDPLVCRTGITSVSLKSSGSIVRLLCSRSSSEVLRPNSKTCTHFSEVPWMRRERLRTSFKSVLVGVGVAGGLLLALTLGMIWL